MPFSASTSYGIRNLLANSAIRQVVPFSRTAKMSLSGLLDSPDRFSLSCSATTISRVTVPMNKKFASAAKFGNVHNINYLKDRSSAFSYTLIGAIFTITRSMHVTYYSSSAF